MEQDTMLRMIEPRAIFVSHIPARGWKERLLHHLQSRGSADQLYSITRPRLDHAREAEWLTIIMTLK